MTSERIQRQIDRLLDEAEAALAENDWAIVQRRSEAVLSIEPENHDAVRYLEAARRGALKSDLSPRQAESQALSLTRPSVPQPTSFVSGRYEVKRFLGEGGKKKVYLAHDTLLDRDVAFALIKTEGLDLAARERITREAQAMGRLGDHPNVVTIFDIGQEDGQPYMVLPPHAGWRCRGLD